DRAHRIRRVDPGPLVGRRLRGGTRRSTGHTGPASMIRPAWCLTGLAITHDRPGPRPGWKAPLPVATARLPRPLRDRRNPILGRTPPGFATRPGPTPIAVDGHVGYKPSINASKSP